MPERRAPALEDAPALSPAVKFAIAKKGRVFAAAILLAIASLQWVSGGGDSGRLQNAIFDTYQRLSPRVVERFPVTIIDIDEATLSQLGQWPWPRTELARLIENTAALGALAIGLDMILSEPDRLSPNRIMSDYLAPDVQKLLAALPSNDAIFAATIRDIPVVLGRAGLPERQPGVKKRPVPSTPIQLTGPDPTAHLIAFADQLVNVEEISQAGWGHGYLNGPRDVDAVVRRMPMVMNVGGRIVPSMGLELIRTALGANWLTVVGDDNGFVAVQVGDARFEADPKGRIMLYFSPADPRRKISAAKVLAGEIAPGALENQVVLIGATGLGLTDVAPTPVSAQMDGVEIQAQFIENILSGAGLRRPGFAVPAEMAAVILAGLALIVLMPGLGPVFGAMLAVGLLAGLTGTSYAAFAKAGVLLDPSFPAMAVAAMFGALFLSLHLESDRNRKILSASLRRQRIENARMAGELSAARDIQMGILPDTDSIEDLPQNIDVHAFLTPAREVGGDLYDVFMIDEHRLFFLVGDVSGKGVSAAMFMAMCKALCKNAAFRDTSQSISDLISTSNIELSRENPSYMFVTAIACVIDTRTGEMEYCNAGHEAPYLCRTGEAPVKLGGDGGPPLCVIDDFEYPLERIQLQAGDTILLFTDGVTDTINSEEQMYGADRLLDHLKSSPNDVAARSVVDALYQDIQRYAGDAAPWDDVAILCLRYLAPGDRDTDS